MSGITDAGETSSLVSVENHGESANTQTRRTAVASKESTRRKSWGLVPAERTGRGGDTGFTFLPYTNQGEERGSSFRSGIHRRKGTDK